MEHWGNVSLKHVQQKPWPIRGKNWVTCFGIRSFIKHATHDCGRERRRNIYSKITIGFLYFSAVDVGQPIQQPPGQRGDNTGEKTVTVTCDQDFITVSPIAKNDTPNIERALLQAKESNIETIEITGDHTILVISVTLLSSVPSGQQAEKCSEILEKLDRIYKLGAEFIGTGDLPYEGEKIRVIFEKLPIGKGVAGATTFINVENEADLSSFLNNGDVAQTVAHEIGHSFEFMFGGYNQHLQEVWPNVFAAYILEKMGAPASQNDLSETSSIPYAEWAYPYSSQAVTMFMEMKDIYKSQHPGEEGWSVFKNFFQEIKENPIPRGISPSETWILIKQAFEKSSGIDLTQHAQKWDFPLDSDRTIIAGPDETSITGGNGDDRLIANAKGTTIHGGDGGEDIYVGGNGIDRLVMKEPGQGAVTVENFDPQDIIVLSDARAYMSAVDKQVIPLFSFKHVMSYGYQRGEDVVFNFGNEEFHDQELVLENMRLEDLTPEHFEYAWGHELIGPLVDLFI